MQREFLKAEWVDRIFQKLSVRYGAAFMAQWRGIDEALVKADWAEQLSSFARRPDCLAYAMDNLPADKPPKVGQFRDLCNAMPEERAPVALIEHKRGPIPANIAKALDKLKEPSKVEGQYQGPKAWAYRLRDREANGEKLGVMQRTMWRQALGVERDLEGAE